MKFNIEEANNLLQNRRSIFPKNYSGERVDDKIINQMLENANWAPTHKMTEPWRFVVFADEGIKTFADFQADFYKENIGEHYQEMQEKKLREKPLLCSHIIAIFMKRNPIVPEIEEISSVAAAVQNMHLTATANGVGCYWTTGGVTYMKGINAEFGMDSSNRLMGFLNVGMPKEGDWPKGKRKSIDEKVNWIRD
ncbi:MAG: nitroreductase [Reichenbachiella sp.]